jgi:hypothetical protein
MNADAMKLSMKSCFLLSFENFISILKLRNPHRYCFASSKLPQNTHFYDGILSEYKIKLGNIENKNLP